MPRPDPVNVMNFGDFSGSLSAGDLPTAIATAITVADFGAANPLPVAIALSFIAEGAPAAIATAMHSSAVLNPKSEEKILGAAGDIFTTAMTVVSPVAVVRFTIAGSVAAIFTLTGWATFSMALNGGVATKSFTFAVEVRAGQVLNIHSDTAGTFKVIASEIIGGVI